MVAPFDCRGGGLFGGPFSCGIPYELVMALRALREKSKAKAADLADQSAKESRIAADRSRDAYGHGRLAALAFIPFANFWLLLTPSKAEASANRAPAIPLLTGGLGVLSGFVLLAAGIGLSAYAQVDGMRRIEEAAAAGVFSEAMLDRTLVTMAAELQTPMTVDETTTIVQMEAVGPEMRYVYEVDPPPDFLPADMRIGLLQQNCAYEGLTGVIDAGAIIKHVQTRRFVPPCLRAFHAPSPSTLIPVLSIERCRGPCDPRNGMLTFNVFWRRRSVLKFGTAQSRAGCTQSESD
jgi:hypothetical protein